ncbi:MAG: Succinate dehydrogenase hydrophobic membrane anchor subunit [Cellvibrionales bacterium UBA7375]|nr:MAG: Succinate dehydrogenase hydrophobic membrane anchor subunit [Cellvibrionales bacterium UBA7375]
MVKSVTSLGRSGLSDWLLQRVSALIMSAYLLFMVGFFVLNPSPSYEQWSGLHSSLAMRIFSLLTILSIAAHAWIGIWCVLTDYITVRLIGPKATPIRMFLQLAMIAVILFYVVWTLDILWGFN